MRKSVYVDDFKLSKGKDAFESMSLVDTIIEQINNGYGKYMVIGLFGAFGEGKSTIVQEIKTNPKLHKGMQEIDVWKYEVADIENALHRIYNMEKDIKSASGNLKQMANLGIPTASKAVAKFLGQDFSLPSLDSGLSKGYTFYQYNLHKEAVDSLVDGFKKALRYQKSIGSICFENLDRCSTEKKIELISSVHKLQEWFKKPILIAIDPHAVDGQKKYFEDLIKKTFHTSHYLKQKTRRDIDNFILQKDNFNPVLREYINSIYPITPRDIHYIYNVYTSKYSHLEKWQKKSLFQTYKYNSYIHITDKMCSNALMAILHVEYRVLYHHLSSNPFCLYHYIKIATRDLTTHSYEVFGYSKKDAKRINKLLLTYYRSFDSFDIFEVVNDISPLLKMDDKLKKFFQTGIIDPSCSDKSAFEHIIFLMIEAYSFYELKEILLKTLSSIKKYNDIYSKYALSMFMASFEDKDMIEVLFIDEAYTTYVPLLFGVHIDKSMIRKILHKSANNFTKKVSKNLAEFILKVTENTKVDISEYKTEFTQIFIEHFELFLSFCEILSIQGKDKVSHFINETITQSLLDHLLCLDIDKLLVIYPYLLNAIKTIKEQYISEYQYYFYIDKIINLLISDIEFIQKALAYDTQKYQSLLSMLQSSSYTQKELSNLLYILKNNSLTDADKLLIYHQVFRLSNDNNNDEFFEDIVYILVDIFLSDKTEASQKEKILHLLYDEAFITRNEWDDYKDIFAHIYHIAIDNISYSKAYSLFCKYAPRVMFSYLKSDSFDTIFDKFSYYNFDRYILDNLLFTNEALAFVRYMYEKQSLDRWYAYDRAKTQSLLISLANLEQDLRYLDNSIDFDKLFENLDFSYIELDNLKDKVSDIQDDDRFKRCYELDEMMKKDSIEQSTLHRWLDDIVLSQDNKVDIYIQRLDYWYKKGKQENIQQFYKISFEYLSNGGSDWLVYFLDKLKKNSINFNITIH